MFASLLTEGRHEFENVPHLKDVDSALKMLSSLGLSWQREKSRLLIDSFHLKGCLPCEKSAQSFRAGILCLGPLLARFGKAQIPLPGGCEIGSRPIDIHLQGLKNMGAEIFVDKGSVFASAPKGGLKACKMKLAFPSVGATENLIMACVLTKGESCLQNPACEPEVEDLICYLNRLGARISRQPGQIKIQGVPRLKAVARPYSIIPDRIEAGTLLLSSACAKGSVLIKNCRPEHLKALLVKLKASGFMIQRGQSTIFLKSRGRHKAIPVKTGVYPLFPTDLQSQFMALMTQLRGLSILEESVFEKRFGYIKQLNLMGANIHIQGQHKAYIQGPARLKSATMKAGDLRAGAGLVLAGLAGEGESRVYGLHHIERGYEDFALKLQTLNARVEICQDSSSHSL